MIPPNPAAGSQYSGCTHTSFGFWFYRILLPSIVRARGPSQCVLSAPAADRTEIGFNGLPDKLFPLSGSDLGAPPLLPAGLAPILGEQRGPRGQHPHRMRSSPACPFVYYRVVCRACVASRRACEACRRMGDPVIMIVRGRWSARNQTRQHGRWLHDLSSQTCKTLSYSASLLG